MLQLLQPVWLFVLTGISIPIAIHLWNQQPGKILKVGSISLIAETSKEYKKNWSLSDLLLLLLRCLLIAAIALAFTKPQWHPAPVKANQHGWVLLPAASTNSVYLHFRPVIDSLLAAGAELHSLSPGFHQLNATALPDSNTMAPTNRSDSYWSMINLLDDTVRGGFPLYLFTDNYQMHFTGKRPVVESKFSWQTYTPTGPFVNQHEIIREDDAPKNISIVTGARINDARYLKAAIEAIRQYSKKNIRLSVVNQHSVIPDNQDWVFWLVEVPVTASSSSKHVFAYEPGVSERRKTWMKSTDLVSIPPIEVSQQIRHNGDQIASGITVWADGFGTALLSLDTAKQHGSFYHFYSRFDPSWSELVWSNYFPALLYSLLSTDDRIAIKTDNRTIDHQQLLPAVATRSASATRPFTPAPIDLAFYSWLLVLALYFIERFVAYRYYKSKGNG